MKEKEPIRHRRDPKLPAPSYKRSRPRSTDHDKWEDEWIQKSEVPATGLFPWKLGTSVDADPLSDDEDALPEVNPDFMKAADEAATIRVYGEWPGEESLSSEAKTCLNDIVFVADNFDKGLINNGKGVKENPIYIGGYPVEKYKAIISEKVIDKRELSYILGQIDALVESINTASSDVVATTPVPTEKKVVPESFIDPRKQFHNNALSAAKIVELALKTPFSPTKPPQEEPEPVPPNPSEVVNNQSLGERRLFEIIERRNKLARTNRAVNDASQQAREPAVEPRTHTEIIKDKLVAEGLVKSEDALKDLVLVMMDKILTSFRRDPSDQAALYRMITSVQNDVAIDSKDIEKLNLFTDNLLSKK